ncbi:MAG: hypothetical protein IPL79_00465 [Myxococcales bacterium]|nr:hypothetical protein [Myxococcales bacterium]
MKRFLAIFLVFTLAAPLATADKWPRGGKPSTHAKLTKRVSTAIKGAYKLNRATQRSGAPTDIAWKGPELGVQTAAIAGSAARQLTKDSLDYAAQRGREPIDVLTGIAVSLGIEQGERMVKSDPLLLAALEILRSAATSGNQASMQAGLQLLEQVLRPSTTP